MGKRIFWLLLLGVAIVCGWYFYKHHQEEVRLANGDVSCDGCMTPEEHERFLKENARGTVDTQSERNTSTQQDPPADSQAVGAGAPAGTAAPSTPTNGTNAGANPSPAATTVPVVETPANQTVAKTRAPAAAGGTYSTGSASLPEGSPPAGDSLSPNAPNGTVFAAKGSYQWYRQGNLTWRVDTVSGRSCIIYATMEEWRKQIVYSHGCGRSA